MKNLTRKIKLKAILLAAVFAAAAAIGTTFAWQTWELSVTNELRAHNTSVTIEENFPHDELGTKEVCFRNTGNSSVFLRVSYTEYWEKEENGETYLLSNLTDGKEIAQIKWSNVSWNGNNSQWYVGEDGWYYYTKILKAGDRTEDIVTQVTFDNIPDEYKEAEYCLYFKAEVVQCSDGSNTLNSPEVNKDATSKLFGMEATVTRDNDNTESVTWRKVGGK